MRSRATRVDGVSAPRLSVGAALTHLLCRAAAAFFGQSPRLRAGRWPGWPANGRNTQRALNQFDQAMARQLAIAVLRPAFLTYDPQLTVRGHTPRQPLA